jgi:hypothetical protein
MTISTKRKNSSKSKSKMMTKSKTNSKSSSRKHLNKSRKNRYKTRKMRGGSAGPKINYSNQSPNKLVLPAYSKEPTEQPEPPKSKSILKSLKNRLFGSSSIKSPPSYNKTMRSYINYKTDNSGEFITDKGYLQLKSSPLSDEIPPNYREIDTNASTPTYRDILMQDLITGYGKEERLNRFRERWAQSEAESKKIMAQERQEQMNAIVKQMENKGEKYGFSSTNNDSSFGFPKNLNNSGSSSSSSSSNNDSGFGFPTTTTSNS